MHIANNLSRCRHVCRGRNSINEFSTPYVMHKEIHTSTIRMLTTVNPCVAVNDGVSDFGPKVHLRGVKAQYTQTWWLRPPPLSMNGLFAYPWVSMFFMFLCVYIPMAPIIVIHIYIL